MPGSVRRLIAFVLLALWLPATSHCAIDAVTGWFADICDAGCDHAKAATDACELVEGGDFSATGVVAKAPAPQLTASVCLICLQARLLAEAEPLAPPAWATGHPRDWIPSWTFSLRNALPARAPDLT